MKKILFLLCMFVILFLSINSVCALTGSIRPAKFIFRRNSSEEFTTEASIEIENLNDIIVLISLQVSENIGEFLEIQYNNFTLQPNESKEVSFEINMPAGAADYDGEISALFVTEKQENTTQQSITVSSQIILLDDVESSCGDGTCDLDESPCSCIEDCEAVCGDGCCNGDETCSSCESDCGECPPLENPPSPPSGGGGSSSGGGGGGGATSTTYTVTQEQLNNRITKNLLEGDKFKFTISDKTHYVKLDSLTPSSATITVSSSPQTFILFIGDEKKVDINNDEVYDLLIKLKNIVGKEAKISVKGISEAVEKSSQIVEETKEEDTASELNKSVNKNSEATEEKAGITGAVIGAVKNNKVKVAVGFVIIFGIVGILLYSYNKSKKNKIVN